LGFTLVEDDGDLLDVKTYVAFQPTAKSRGGREELESTRGSLHEADSNLEIPPTQKTSVGEALFLSCASLCLLLSCILWSPHKQVWFDEIFTWREVSDPSLWHLYYAIQHGADGGQPLFYTTAWLWAKAFGTSVLALRLYSSVAICGALVVTWRAIRRFYGIWATAFGVLAFWGTSGLLLDQNVEGRFYGLYMLTVAVTVNLYARLVTRTAAPSRLLLAFAFFSQAALVFSHVLGIIYSGLILLALVLVDAAKGRLRFKLYLVYAAGWLPLLLWLPAIRSSMAAGKPHSWIAIPLLMDLRSGYWFSDASWWRAFFDRHAHKVIFQIVTRASEVLINVPQAAVLVFGIIKIRKQGWRVIADPQGALLLLAYVLLAMLLVLFVLSYVVTPVFAPRYFLPSGIGMAILLAACAHALGADRQAGSRLAARLAWTAVVLFLMILPVLTVLALEPIEQGWAYLDVHRLEETIPPGLPVVAAWEPDFVKLMRLAHDPGAHFFDLLDWPSALAGQRGSVLGYHLMQAYRANGYFSKNIQDNRDFLCAHPDFVVLDAPNANTLGGTPSPETEMNKPNWFDINIKTRPEFEWKPIASFDGPTVVRELIAVHRRAPLDFCGRP
jgi:hypothetical protein